MGSFLPTFTYAYKAYHNQLNDLLSPHQFTSPQWALLRYLVESGPAMLSEVATYWQMERPSITPVAQKLYNRELIYMAPGQDKRQKVMHASEKGKELYKVIRTEMNVFQEEILKGVSEEERQVTESVLERMIINLMIRNGS